MSENSEPLTEQDKPAAKISHRRILYEMSGVIVAGAIAGFVFFSAKVGWGVLVGGVLSFANYFWQKHSIKAIFDRAIAGRRSRFLALRYVLRYVVLGAALAGVYFTQTVSIFAVIFGLAGFAIAVMIEGFTSIFSSSDRQED
jgi:hypothetical protein